VAVAGLRAVLPLAEIPDERVGEALNQASFAAGNLVYDFAAKFDKAEDYRPLEKLAQAVQAAVVRTGTEVLRRG
jgi:hypothetical protein